MKRDEKYAPLPLKEKGTDIISNTGKGDSRQDTILMKPLKPEENSQHHPGLCFQDGQRRVDYVLTYNVKKPQRSRSRRASSHLVNNAFFDNLPCCKGPQPDPEAGAQAESLEHHEDGKQLQREEFEGNLMEMGLELEKDENSKIPGVGFLKVHAPFHVLCREAEFMKLRMPTKKVFEVKQGNKLLDRINTFIHKITEPLLPNVEDKRRNHTKRVCYPFSREKEHLFDMSDRDSFFDSNTRSLIVYEVLKRTKIHAPEHSMGITSLLGNGAYTALYPLHDGDIDGEHTNQSERKLLYEQWAGYRVFYKYQPIGLIRKYFGEKIGLYFAWLGVYTQMLIVASVVGVLVFLYGCFTVDGDITSMEICDPLNNITMCPLCDMVCGYWKLTEACGTAQASHLFDNGATVLFSIFMALWAAMFMEHWKRKQVRLNYLWGMAGFEEDQNHPRAEYELRVLKKSIKKQEIYRKREKAKVVKLTCKDRFPAYMTTIVMLLLMITITFSIVFGVILYRIATKAALHMSSSPAARANAQLTVKTTAAIINLVVIIILDEVYGAIARWLTVLEVPKTDKSFEERLIYKAFILKFVNAFTPIIYIAFFRGKLVGRPGSYLYAFKSFRMEECTHAGCLMELCVQLSITMLGKQLLQNNLFEIGIPKLKKLIRYVKTKRSSVQEEESCEKQMQRYETDHFLSPFVGLNPEYMEMIVQFGFVTLFVASFPLAPLIALINNVIEIRLDAKKFVGELRRPVAARAKTIGIWYNILRGISKVAVIVNAFVIAFTSDFVPRLVYLHLYSPDGTMHGFVNHTLSYFNVSHFQEDTQPMEPLQLGYRVKICRYKDYREPPWSQTPYQVSAEFWSVLAARLAFVIVFQNVVMLLSDLVDWIIPDVPKQLTQQMHEEKAQMIQFFMEEERRLRGMPDNMSFQGGKEEYNQHVPIPSPCSSSSPSPSNYSAI